MDRGGRLSGTLNLRQAPEGFTSPPGRFALFVHRLAARTGKWRVLRGIEIVFVTILLAATALYGAIRGGHADAILESLHDVADVLAQRAGYQSANVSIEGAARLRRADVLRIAGITESSTLFLIDADATRARTRARRRHADRGGRGGGTPGAGFPCRPRPLSGGARRDRGGGVDRRAALEFATQERHRHTFARGRRRRRVD